MSQAKKHILQKVKDVSQILLKNLRKGKRKNDDSFYCQTIILSTNYFIDTANIR